MSSATTLLAGALALAIIFFLILLKDTVFQTHGGQPSSKPQPPSMRDGHDTTSKLMRLVRFQNATIAQLERALESAGGKIAVEKALEPPCPAQAIGTVPPPPPPPLVPSALESLTSRESECERRYGGHLIETWRQNRQIWCDSPQSQLICYPYHQAHKKLDGRPSDVFCEATNMVLDFSKVTGSHGSHKPSLGMQYLHFQPGSLASTCRKTSQFQDRLFMPHHRVQMNTFIAGASSASAHDQVEDTTTYLLARDEDCENSFHSTADFMNMYLVMQALGVDPKQQQVMLFDQHPDGPYVDLIRKAYSPHHPLLRHQHYSGKKVLFKRLIFHLESPAGLIFPKVANPDPLKCYDTTLFQAYRRHVLQSFALLDVAPPPIPEVTLILRHRTERKNVGRVMANEAEVVSVLKTGTMMNLNVVDLAKMSFSDQIALVRKSNVLVGIHGAGLMHIMFAAEEAVLVEIHPSYRQDRHFRHASRMTRKIYMPMRSLTRESCQGSSDNVVVPLDEFAKTMDGALRVARNFDDGISECGLVCPKEILALDPRLDAHYTRSFSKGRAVSTHFPCG